MIEKVRKTINRYGLLERDDHVVLGLSGGPDSVTLFHVLRELGAELSVVHVDHGLRETAARDRAFVQSLCADAGVPCTVVSEDCGSLAAELGITTEEAGRKVRYEAFVREADRIRAGGRSVKIAVAHNADDQAETLMFRIIRGTGTDGLAGMEHARREGDHVVIRPLLDVTRREIEDFCRERSLAFVTDETNGEPVYTRNRIRLELLPYIRENFNGNVDAGLCRLAEIAGTDRDYLAQRAGEAYELCARREGGEVVLRRGELAGLHPAIRRRVIMKAARQAGLGADMTYERLCAVEEAVEGDGKTRVIQLPHGFEAVVEFGQVRVRKAAIRADAELSGGRTAEELSGDRADAELPTIRAEVVKGPRADALRRGYPEGTVVLDADLTAEAAGITTGELEGAVHVRRRREGDVIRLAGGTKRLRKLLGEMKIPAGRRDSAVILAAGDVILAVADDTLRNVRYAETLRANDKTEAVLTVKFV